MQRPASSRPLVFWNTGFKVSKSQGSPRGDSAAAKPCNFEILKPDLHNWILIGIGDIATRRVIPAIQAEPRSRLYGLVTRDPAKAVPYGVRVWSTLDEALADPEVHAVYVGTPVFLHAPQTIQSLRAGKHVLCEKPMAMNEAEARTMVQAADESGKTFGVAYYRRSYPKVQRAKQLLAAGVIGKPVVAELTNHMWFDGARQPQLAGRSRQGRRRPALRRRLAPHRRSEFSFWPAAASDGPTLERGASLRSGRQRHSA